jgi:hypothetical protein
MVATAASRPADSAATVAVATVPPHPSPVARFDRRSLPNKALAGGSLTCGDFRRDATAATWSARDR